MRSKATCGFLVLVLLCCVSMTLSVLLSTKYTKQGKKVPFSNTWCLIIGFFAPWVLIAVMLFIYVLVDYVLPYVIDGVCVVINTLIKWAYKILGCDSRPPKLHRRAWGTGNLTLDDNGMPKPPPYSRRDPLPIMTQLEILTRPPPAYTV